MQVIDASQGEGGGQILRTALSLSMCLQEPIRLHNIRAGRKKSGLLRQHLTCVRAAKEICSADVIGDEPGSDCIEFYPDKIQSGQYHFAIGTAGSTTLVFQTILPALLQAENKSIVTFEGGTHNNHAPSFDFIEQSFLPIIQSMGYKVNSVLQQHGFYPAGGGQWQTEIEPLTTTAHFVELLTRQTIHTKQAVALSARIPKHVCERELKQVQKQCGWADDNLKQHFVQSYGPGNILSLRLSAENISKVFDAVGQFGVSAERVANKAISAMQRYLNSDAVVDDHLCDQLLLPLALGSGGCFTTLKPSLHTLTNIDIIRMFVECRIDVSRIGEDSYRISIEK